VGRIQRIRLCHSLLRRAEVVDRSVQTHVALQVNAIAQRVHDLIDAPFKELPPTRLVSMTSLPDVQDHSTHVPLMSSFGGMAIIPVFISALALDIVKTEVVGQGAGCEELIYVSGLAGRLSLRC